MSDRVRGGARAGKRRARLVRTLQSAGVLPDPAWRAAFGAVPRHAFLDRFFRAAGDGTWLAVDRDDGEWLDQVYADQVLVTQLDGDPARWAVARDTGPVFGVPTSSSSQPAIMAVMLSILDVAPGQRVLEIGTGTGYNAALLCHRLGAANVTTVDIDVDLAAVARERLAECGYTPTCLATDGAEGHPGGAPYDRVLATCAVARIPLPWLTQTTPGGLVVTTLHRPLGAGLVRITVGEGATGEGRVLAEDGRFMPLRAHRLTRTARLDETTGAVRLEHPDGSWVRHSGGHGPHEVWQGGPRRLWDVVERAYQEWQALGRPARDRFGLTVRPDRQELWLDEPAGAHRWSL
jgi:protein-L-isoaspartate O-methyltransferase